MNFNTVYKEGQFISATILDELADAITSAEIPNEENRWERVFGGSQEVFVKYSKATRTTLGKYLHTDNKLYDVYKIKSNTFNELLVDGFLYETQYATRIKTGFKLPVVSHTATNLMSNQSETYNLVGSLFAVVPDTNGRVKAIRLGQIRKELDNTFQARSDWNEFQYLNDLPSEWSDFVNRATFVAKDYRLNVDANQDSLGRLTNRSFTMLEVYSFTETYYTANQITTASMTPASLLLKCSPTPPAGKTQKDFYLLFTQPANQYNYITLQMCEDFVGTPQSGDPELTYKFACDVSTIVIGRSPTVINQKEAEKVFNSPDIFVPAVIKFKKELDGTELKAPESLCFYGTNLAPIDGNYPKRKPYYGVNYVMNISNSRILLVLEGDPGVDFNAYYRNFVYIGQIGTFDDNDYESNFATTCGMGVLNLDISGFDYDSLNPSASGAKYASYGTNTSNGMDSISMLRTKGNVPFQRYYPAYLTQLPNYVTLPNSKNQTTTLAIKTAFMSRLPLDSTGFQSSIWSGHYHASPCYVVHPYEGYRGYLDGVVAITKQNIINYDELIVDTEVPRDPNDPTKGNYQEIYKYVNINTPINMFRTSPNPVEMSIAILKEIK